MHGRITVSRLILIFLNQSVYDVEGLPHSPPFAFIVCINRGLKVRQCTLETLNRMGESSRICEPLGRGILEGRIDGAVARP
jgi:hypothetical protein